MVENVSRVEVGPLSVFQSGIWIHVELDPKGSLLNNASILSFQVDLDAPAMARAWQAFCDRHPALRTTFHKTADGTEQRVHSHYAAAFTSHDVRALTDDDLRQRVTADFSEPFDLAKHAARVVLYERPGGSLLMVVMHHIASDLMSADLMHDELPKFYEAARAGRTLELPPLPATYLDFVRDQAAELSGPQGAINRDFWLEHLRAANMDLALPVDVPRRDGRRAVGATLPFSLDASLSQKLAALSEGSTAYRTLLAAYAVFISRITGQESFVIGTPADCRGRDKFKDVVGDFVNMLALPFDLSGNPSFRELVASSTVSVRQALQHRSYPFQNLVVDLRLPRDPNRNPVYQTVFRYGVTPRVPALAAHPVFGAPWKAHFGPHAVEPFHLPQQEGKLDLQVVLTPVGDELYGEFKYCSDVFSEGSIRRYLDCFKRLLEKIADAPDAPIRSHEIVSSAEVETAVVAWNRTSLKVDPTSTAPSLVLKQMRATPNATALVSAEGAWTYAELDAAADRWCGRFRAAEVGPGSVVALAIPRSREMVAAVLGVWRAGAAYVALDPALPMSRMRFMVEDAGARWLATAPSATLAFAELDIPILTTDDAAPTPGTFPTVATRPDALAYVLYTSGSTGKPKGVRVVHGSVGYFLQWLHHEFPLASDDRLLQTVPLSFDVSVRELWWPLSSGAALVVPRPDGERDFAYLADLVRRHRATQVRFGPAALRELLEFPDLAPWDSVRRFFTGGEELPDRTRHRFFERFPTKEFVNTYGPTETTVNATFHRCQPGENPSGRVPIGRPIANATAYVLDSDRRPVPIGVTGELYVGGAGVAAGYQNLPELTEARFVPNPFAPAGDTSRLYATGDLVRFRDDGNLEFLGRIDTQVKVHGHRIELQEIENVLLSAPALRGAAACVVEPTPGDKRIVAYVVGNDVACTEASLKDLLGEHVPAYMIPWRIVFLSELPTRAGGKVDRLSLARRPIEGPQRTESAHTAELTHTEARLLPLWLEVLELADGGIDDDFFDLGGHSITTIRLTGRLAAVFGVDLGLEAVLEAPTVRKLAARLDDIASHSVENRIVELVSTGALPPLVLLHAIGGNVTYYGELSRLLGDRRVFAVRAGTAPQRHASIQDLAGSYVAEIRSALGDSPIYVGGWSFGGLVALELARHLVAAGVTVLGVVMIDTHLLLPDETPETPEQMIQRDAASATPDALGLTKDDQLEYYQHNVVLRRKHHPVAEYSGEVTLVRATTMSDAERGRWQTSVPRLRILPVEGDHYSILRRPILEVTATQFRRGLGESL